MLHTSHLAQKQKAAVFCGQVLSDRGILAGLMLSLRSVGRLAVPNLCSNSRASRGKAACGISRDLRNLLKLRLVAGGLVGMLALDLGAPWGSAFGLGR